MHQEHQIYGALPHPEATSPPVKSAFTSPANTSIQIGRILEEKVRRLGCLKEFIDKKEQEIEDQCVTEMKELLDGDSVDSDTLPLEVNAAPEDYQLLSDEWQEFEGKP